MTPPLRFAHYVHDGREEAIVQTGPVDAPRHLLIIPPLFDEMNRMRRTLILAMRDAAGRGLTCSLIDLPGCHESMAEMAAQTLDHWRRAAAAAAHSCGATHVVSVRGGGLIDSGVPLPRWRLSPVAGAPLIKAMLRTRIAAEKEAGRAITTDDLRAMAAKDGVITLGGTTVSQAMWDALESATIDSEDALRTVQVGAEAGPDTLIGRALWMRAEPGEDTAMASAMAADWDAWSGACGG